MLGEPEVASWGEHLRQDLTLTHRLINCRDVNQLKAKVLTDLTIYKYHIWVLIWVLHVGLGMVLLLLYFWRSAHTSRVLLKYEMIW